MISTSRRIKAEDYTSKWMEEFYRRYDIPDALRPRKIWEFGIIMQVIEENKPSGMCRALGFGVGREPISRWLAQQGFNQVTATDYINSGWSEGQHATCLADIQKGWAYESIEFRNADMNHIPEDLKLEGYDFVWSCSSLEHIGGKEAGLRFVNEAMKCLRPGGLAIHTTELAVWPGEFNGGTLCLYNNTDLEQFERETPELWPLDLEQGNTVDDTFIVSKYEPGRLGVNMQVYPGVATTSVLLVLRKSYWEYIL